MPDIDAITGKSLHIRRLESIASAPSTDDGECVKWFHSDGYVCVVCDARSNDRDHVHHTRPNCQVEYKAIMSMMRYLKSEGIEPFATKKEQ